MWSFFSSTQKQLKQARFTSLFLQNISTKVSISQWNSQWNIKWAKNLKLTCWLSRQSIQFNQVGFIRRMEEVKSIKNIWVESCAHNYWSHCSKWPEKITVSICWQSKRIESIFTMQNQNVQMDNGNLPHYSLDANLLKTQATHKFFFLSLFLSFCLSHTLFFWRNYDLSMSINYIRCQVSQIPLCLLLWNNSYLIMPPIMNSLDLSIISLIPNHWMLLFHIFIYLAVYLTLSLSSCAYLFVTFSIQLQTFLTHTEKNRKTLRQVLEWQIGATLKTNWILNWSD